VPDWRPTASVDSLSRSGICIQANSAAHKTISTPVEIASHKAADRRMSLS
jgi:hypothetical protein